MMINGEASVTGGFKHMSTINASSGKEISIPQNQLGPFLVSELDDSSLSALKNIMDLRWI